jgi:hypothetical protein
MMCPGTTKIGMPNASVKLMKADKKDLKQKGPGRYCQIVRILGEKWLFLLDRPLSLPNQKERTE